MTMRTAAAAIAMMTAAACSGRGDSKPGDGATRGEAVASSDASAARSADASAIPALDAGGADADVGPIAVALPAGRYRGPDCRAAYAPRPDRDDAPMCFQPGGRFLVGSPDGEGTPAEHPQRAVTLSPFFLDQFEVTRGQYARFNRADVPPDQARLPMVDVTVEEAAAYCAWAGKMLPTNARWEYAARVEPLTGRLRRFPWGDQFHRAWANCSPPECSDGKIRDVVAVDLFPRDVSATGVRGLAANVSEWTIDCWTATIPDCGQCVDPAPPRCEGGLSMRGGNPISDPEDVRGALRLDEPLGVTKSDMLGFRCAADAITDPSAVPAPSR